MSLEQTAAPDSAPSSDAPMSSGDLAGLFRAELDAESAPQPKQPEAPAEAAPEQESALPEAEAVEAEQDDASEPSESQTPVIEAPSGMSEADRAVYEQLPPEAQAWIAKRVKDQQADYTKKTQEVAESRKQLEVHQSRVMEQLKQYDHILSQFADRPLVPPDPALRQTDPLAYEDQVAQYLQAKHHQEIAAQEREKVRAEYKAKAEEQQQRYWAEQSTRLAELAPELAAATPQAKELRRSVLEYGMKNGYSKEVLNQASAQDLVTLWKAQKYDAAMSKKPATPVKPAAPKVMQPGPAKAAGRTNGFASAVKALSENPTRAALAEAFRAELAAER